MTSAIVRLPMTSDPKSSNKTTLQVENADLRHLLTQAGIDAAHLLAKASLDATKNAAAGRVQQLLLKELHHRVKNMLATVIAITSRSLRSAETLEQGRVAVESRLIALGRAHDVLLQAQSAGAKLTDVAEVQVLLARPEDFAGLNEAYAQFFPKDPPVRSVARLGPDLGSILVSIKLIAVVPE